MEQKTEYVTAGRKYEFTDHVKPFWIVLSPGRSDQVVECNTQSSAEDTAFRLAREHPGVRFIVFKSSSEFRFHNVGAIHYG